MREWGSWEWAGFIALWVTVALSAFDQSLKLMPKLAQRVKPSAARTRIWFRAILAFAPLGLLIFATLILVGHATGIIGGHPPSATPTVESGSIASQVHPPSRFYSSSEKEELANRISSLSIILNKDLPDIASQWDHESEAALENFTSKSDLVMFLGRLDLLHQKTKTLNQKLWIDTVNGNPDFSSDLRSIIGGDNAPLNKLKTAIQNYRNAVEVISLIFGYVDNDSMVKFVHLMRPFKISLQEASTRLIRWKDEVNPRIAAKRQTL